MNATPTQRFLEILYSVSGEQAKTSGGGWIARCPGHDDRNPSLSIAEGNDGRALVKCHAGCEVDDICATLGLPVVDLMPIVGPSADPGKNGKDGQRRIAATYDYRNEASELLFQVVRFEPKEFRQRRPKAGGGWDWSVKGVRQVPYRLPELLATPVQTVFVVEGEKDVDNFARIGVLATCNAGGAGKWTTEHSDCLQGRDVVVLADNDQPGHQHAQKVALSLHGVANSVRVVALPGLPEKGDSSDWLADGGSREELSRLIAEAPEWEPSDQPWPEIESFDFTELPAFPTQVLSPVLRHYVEAESHATQTPADLAGLLTLAVCSAMIARRVTVEPRPGWREPVNLYVAVLLEPGNRKSAVFTDSTRPLQELENENIESARPMVAELQSERRQSELRLKKLEKRAAEKDDLDSGIEAKDLAVELAGQPNPVLPRLIVDDATSEKLEIILAEQGGRIASMSPEGSVFDLMAGRYSKIGMTNFDVYLKGHAGDDLKTERVSRDSILVERPAITCAYAMQPAVIKGLAENAAFRGRGLLARFLYAAPESWIGEREIAPTPVSDSLRQAYHRSVRNLVDFEGEFTLTLEPEANAAFQVWESEIERMLGDGGQMEIVRDWGGKLAGATLRLAAVMHCIEYGLTKTIGSPTIAAAVEIARYLIPHAEAVLTSMHAHIDPVGDDARYVLKWIKRHDKRDFTKREAQQHGKRRFPKADDIDPALDELVRRGYIRLKPSERSSLGRKPSPRYEVNPAVFSTKEPQKRSQNAQNSIQRSNKCISENIESAFRQSETENRVQVTI